MGCANKKVERGNNYHTPLINYTKFLPPIQSTNVRQSLFLCDLSSLPAVGGQRPATKVGL